jgi:cellulase
LGQVRYVESPSATSLLPVLLRQDTYLGERGKRIAFAAFAQFPLQNISSPDIACGSLTSPAQLTAPARAGSNVTMFWSPWVESHRGPLTNYLAPYSGDISEVNVNALKFFKIAEEGLGADGKTWATDRMVANNGTWTTTIPADIQPGTYVLRHELLALHFATSNSNYWYIPGGRIGPQFYVSCYSINVTGPGHVVPEGVTFPGVYKEKDPGLVFDIFKKPLPKYNIPGPAVHKTKMMFPPLEPKPVVVTSPTGDSEMDEIYFKAIDEKLAQLGSTGSYFNSIGG